MGGAVCFEAAKFLPFKALQQVTSGLGFVLDYNFGIPFALLVFFVFLDIQVATWGSEIRFQAKEVDLTSRKKLLNV